MLNGSIDIGWNCVKIWVDHTDLITIVNPIVLASSPETVDKLEGLVGMWSKEIELVLAESEQVFSIVTYKGLVLIMIYEKIARVWTLVDLYFNT